MKIPFRSLQAFQKVSDKVVSHLESKFNWPVIVVANRTIISKRAKHHATQQRPRSRTLTAVHNALLEDIVIFWKWLIWVLGLPSYHCWQKHKSNSWWKEAYENLSWYPRQGEGWEQTRCYGPYLQQIHHPKDPNSFRQAKLLPKEGYWGQEGMSEQLTP